MEEKIVETKICKHCQENFEITDKDIEFYEKVSPVFNSIKYQIPSPTLCPDCRQQRRLVWRNERSLYRTVCAATGKNIISCFSSDKKYSVYEPVEWWSDKWDPLDYWKDFDFSKTFFEQFWELLLVVPKMSVINNLPENSDYCNQTTWLKNCYLCYNSVHSEDCQYSKGLSRCTNTLDCLKVYDSSECYECIDSHNCFKWSKLRECSECSECTLCKDCISCSNCFWCVGLRNTSYEIFNIKYNKDEYRKKLEEIKDNKALITKEFNNLLYATPHKYINTLNSEKYIWDNVYESKNVIYGFDIVWGEEIRYCTDLRGPVKNNMDACIIWNNLSTSYETCATWINATHCLFTDNWWQDVSDLYYSQFCVHWCTNCFWCVGLKWKSYCILNKQYAKDEYEELVPKIIEHMKKTWEWWEFFPSWLSPFWYNETVACEYYPLEKDQALLQGFKWSEYKNPKPDVSKIIPASKLPRNISEIPDDIINWAIECEVTWKPFRIIKSELEFYRKHNLPIPHKHPDERHMDRMRLRNPRKLFDRKCMECWINIKTTFAPERSEIIYCENCYDK
ncbi:MAG: hypothetical protein ACD_4C00212G0001 [uncultured bacterium (gcode 4)]|uniref:Uncharacterized protein n=1 Tax=uncultured bacterium (gcode 4) TaxID=1234023 RepID=K2GTI5_9BACT|nr:MAG: hypothetical protein ACD_4C00212G0001 [uncultured bacterium (gcode 4)]